MFANDAKVPLAKNFCAIGGDEVNIVESDSAENPGEEASP